MRLLTARGMPEFAEVSCWLVGMAVCAALVLAGGNQISSADEPEPTTQPTATQLEFFNSKIKPILDQHCLRCHGGKENPKGGLLLTSRAGVLRGGDSGPAVSLEHPDDSLLVQAINYSGYEMPPSGKLPKESIEALTQWVRRGLPYPTQAEITAEPPLKTALTPPKVDAESKRFWSFQPVRRPALPTVVGRADTSHPIDAFIEARLAAAGLRMAEPAAKTALLRRVYYDLTGLPPEPSDVAAFVTDDSPQAYARVVDRLLESPHYGEKWGRHWLDLVRYAESNSYERDGAKPFAWRYRDYVIRSFNDDKPYDQFVREQLAGDELTPVTPDGIIATGFYRLGIWDDEPADPEQALYDDLDDIVQTTGQVFLGLTIGCARCHAHKLDPIPHEDYYRFLAFFRNVRRYGARSHESVLEASVRKIAVAEDQRLHAELVAEYEQQLANVERQLVELDDRVKPTLGGVEVDDFQTESARLEIVRKRVPGVLSEGDLRRYQTLTRQRDKLRGEKHAGLAQALCVTEAGSTAPPTHVLIRGNPHVPGELVEPGFPQVLDAPAPQVADGGPSAATCGRRLALANWLTDPANPLTARVMANRIWQHHFGRGIVRSSSDFGFQGTPPTHPELLDWLAAELVAGGWRLKRLHKLILLSRAYQASSHADAESLAKDPDNNLLGRYSARRLSAEEIRDSILAVNESLNRTKMFGPSIFVRIPDEVLAGQSRPGDGWGKSSPEDENRRSIYIHVKRSLLAPVLTNFDAADTDNSCPVRFVTTQPTQALGMLNGSFLQEQSRRFADYLREQVGDEPAKQIATALQRCLQRPPTADEVARGVSRLETLREKHQLSPADALHYFCLVTLNLNEFLYLD